MLRHWLALGHLRLMMTRWLGHLRLMRLMMTRWGTSAASRRLANLLSPTTTLRRRQICQLWKGSSSSHDTSASNFTRSTRRSSITRRACCAMPRLLSAADLDAYVVKTKTANQMVGWSLAQADGPLSPHATCQYTPAPSRSSPCRSLASSARGNATLQKNACKPHGFFSRPDPVA